VDFIPLVHHNADARMFDVGIGPMLVLSDHLLHGHNITAFRSLA